MHNKTVASQASVTLELHPSTYTCSDVIHGPESHLFMLVTARESSQCVRRPNLPELLQRPAAATRACQWRSFRAHSTPQKSPIRKVWVSERQTANSNGRPADNPRASAVSLDGVKKNQPLGELSAAEKEAFHKMAAASRMQLHQSPVSPMKSLSRTTAGAISILEELFPKELSREVQSAKAKRRVPRVPLEVRIPDEAPDAPTDHTKPHRGFSDPETAPSVAEESRVDDGVAVVVLRKAGSHLMESDFRRLMPGGRHIEGWSSQGDLLKVIRVRDRTSLDRQREYILVFSDAATAQRFINHVNEVHLYCKANRPGSMFSAVPPPPLLDEATGEVKFTSPVYTYSLVPLSHEPSLRLVRQPFSPLMQEIVQLGGYPSLTETQGSKFEVLLSFTGFLATVQHVHSAMEADGRTRGAFWRTGGRGRGVRQLDAPSAPAMDFELDLDDSGYDPDEDPSNRPSRIRTRKFVVSFEDEQEAVRFAAAWHRKDVTGLMDAQLLHPWTNEAIISKAEVAW